MVFAGNCVHSSLARVSLVISGTREKLLLQGWKVMEQLNLEPWGKSPVLNKLRIEESLLAKSECDRARDDKTRINIGSAFWRWRELRDLKSKSRDGVFYFSTGE